jgi:hypothetical protein
MDRDRTLGIKAPGCLGPCGGAGWCRASAYCARVGSIQPSLSLVLPLSSFLILCFLPLFPRFLVMLCVHPSIEDGGCPGPANPSQPHVHLLAITIQPHSLSLPPPLVSPLCQQPSLFIVAPVLLAASSCLLLLVHACVVSDANTLCSLP